MHDPEPADASILGDIDAFIAALEAGTMQAQWEKEQARAQAWLAGGPRTTTCDAAED